MSVAPLLQDLLTTADQILQRLQHCESSIADKLPENQLSELETETLFTEQASVKGVRDRLWIFCDPNQLSPLKDPIVEKLGKSIEVLQKLYANRLFSKTYIDLDKRTMEALGNPDAAHRVAELQSLHKRASSVAKKNLFPNNSALLEKLIDLIKTSLSKLPSDRPQPNPLVSRPSSIKKPEIQSEKEQRVQVPAFQPSQIAIFKELKMCVDQLNKELKTSDLESLKLINHNIETHFNQLADQDKKSLLSVYNAVLKQKKRISQDLPETIYNKSLAQWVVSSGKGSWIILSEALGQILAAQDITQLTRQRANTEPAPQTSVTASTPSAPLSRPLSPAPAPSTPVSSAQPIYSAFETFANLSTSSFKSLFSSVTPAANPSAPIVSSVLQISQPAVRKNNSPIIMQIERLRALLPLIQENAKDSDEVTKALSVLDAEDLVCIFKLTGTTASKIAERPYFHLHSIHKNESPQKLQNDPQYGNKAFSGVYEATKIERQRSIHRTIVEVALQGLEDAINVADQAENFHLLLDVLERVKLNPKDRAQAHDCAAHFLYTCYYQLQMEAYKNKRSLVDPHSDQFKGEFGRHGFRGSINGIDPTSKLKAIKQVQAVFKEIWKL